MPIFGREHDFQLVQLVPLLFRAIPVGNRPKLLQARSRRIRLRLVHDRYYLILRQFIGSSNLAAFSASASTYAKDRDGERLPVLAELTT
jgi:hypothetical protein